MLNGFNDLAATRAVLDELDDKKAEELYLDEVRKGVNRFEFIDKVGLDEDDLKVVNGVSVYGSLSGVAGGTEVGATYGWGFWVEYRNSRPERARRGGQRQVCGEIVLQIARIS